MLVTYEEAVEIYEEMALDGRYPSLHPYYVMTDALRDKSLTPCFFVFNEGTEVFYYPFHLSKISETEYFDIQSPYGYGGPVSTSDRPSFLSDAWTAYLRWCQEANILAEFVRFHPLLDNWKWYNGDSAFDRPTVWMNLLLQEPMLSNYKTRARTAVRKAIKSGLTVDVYQGSGFSSLFSELYHNTMTSLNASEFYFFNDEYIGSLLDWQKSVLFLCKIETEVVAGSIFLIDGLNMEYHLSASNLRGKELGATNLILHHAVEFGKNNGLSRLHMGGGTTNEIDNPLLFFKKGFSDNLAEFKIGSYIHNKTIYQQWKSDWEKAYGRTNRVLFYR